MSSERLNDELIDGWWDIARAGSWKGTLAGAPALIEITPEDLVRMAGDYDPLLQEAPVTVEHRREGPAHGWVAALRVAGDRLQARFTDLSENLRDWLRSGAYCSRSIEMYKPFESTGRAYLGAVSFLGAAPPAVKGLAPLPSLMAGEEETDMTIRLECAAMELEEIEPVNGGNEMDEKSIAGRAVRSLKEMFSGTDNRRRGDGEAAPAAAESPGIENPVELRETLVAERRARQEAENRLAELENALRSREREAELAEFAATLEAAAKAERLTPAELKGYYRLGVRLDREGRGAILAEVAERRPLAVFRELSALPQKDDTGAETERRRAQFEGFPEDPEHDAALELMAAEPALTFAEAIKRVRLKKGA